MTLLPNGKVYVTYCDDGAEPYIGGVYSTRERAEMALREGMYEPAPDEHPWAEWAGVDGYLASIKECEVDA